MPATHPGATLRLSTLEVWEAIGQVRETQVQQANLLTALTHALTVTLVTPVMGPEKRVPRDSIQGAILSSSAIQESVLNEFDEEDKNDVIDAIERFTQLQIEANVGLQLANLDKLIRDSTSYPSLSQLLQVIQTNSINTTNPLETLLNHRRLQIEDGSDTAVCKLWASVEKVRESFRTAESEVNKQL